MNEFLSDNLLVVLHRWASSQDENFITDSFAHLLRRLMLYDPTEGIMIVNFLTEGTFRLNQTDAASISVTTQVTTALGRPDIEIRTLDCLIYIEAKVESGLREDQLRNYIAELDKSSLPRKALVFLSRYPVQVSEAIKSRVICKRWYQIADWLSTSLANNKIQDNINVFLAKQFIGFLKQRNITMEQVTWELPNGIKSLRELLVMLGEALTSHKCNIGKSAAWDWIGYYVVEDSPRLKPFFIGIMYDQPDMLVFATEEVPVIPEATTVAGFGKLVTDKYRPGGTKWSQELPLASEEIHFFALSRASQLRKIEEFLRVCLDAGNKVRVK